MLRILTTTALVLLAAAPASAASHTFFTPQTRNLGGSEAVGVYEATGFDPGVKLSGAALADAALKELSRVVTDAKGIAVAYAGDRATITLPADKLTNPAVADAALGAVYYTLVAAGFTDIRGPEGPLTAAAFSRGAFLPIVPLAAALPPQIVEGGFVRVGDAVIPSATFYPRLSAGDDAIRQAAQQQLESAPVATKLALLDKIGALGFSDVDGVLIARLSDTAPAVRLAALSHLQRNGNKPVVKALETVVAKDEDGDVKLAAVRILVKLGKSEYGKYLLLDKLADPNAAVVIDALKGLVKTKDGAFAPSIAKLAAHANASVRDEAVASTKALGRLDLMAGWLATDTAVPPAVQAKAARILADEAKGTERAAGISWLVASGGADDAIYGAKLAQSETVPGTTLALGGALSRSEAEVRVAAAHALAALKDTAGLEPLAGAVRDAKSPEDKALFSAKATEIIAVQPVDQVIAIAGSPDLTIRELAIRALAKAGGDRPSPKAVAVLDTALAEKEPGIRQAAAFALARVADDSIRRKLLRLKDDKDPQVRAQVAHALGFVSDPGAEATLTAYLDDREPAVKVAAIEAVTAKKLTGTVDKIKWLTSHRYPEVKRAAMAALVALASQGDPKLIDIYAKAMLEQDNALRRSAVDGLAGYPDQPKASEAIGIVVNDEAASKELKLHALGVLTKMTEPNVWEHVVRGLFDRDKAIKLATLDALASLKSDKATRPLQEFILGESDKEVAARAEQVLENL